MTFAKATIENAQQQIDMAVDTATPVTLGVCVAVGLLLWFMGKKITRPATTLCGLVLGASAVFVVTQQLTQSGEQIEDGMLLLWLAGGALAGALFAAMIYRIWMGTSMAVLAALIVAAAGIVWVGDTDKTNTATDANSAQAAVDKQANQDSQSGSEKDKNDSDANTSSSFLPENPTGDLPVNSLTTEQIQDGVDKVLDSETMESIKSQFLKLLKNAYAHQAVHVQSWWQQVEESGQRNTYITMLIGAAVGLLLGFAAPDFSASIQTSLVGGFLIICSGRGLAAVYAPDFTSWLPDTPPKMLMTLGLITVIGIGVQWTIWRDKTDK